MPLSLGPAPALALLGNAAWTTDNQVALPPAAERPAGQEGVEAAGEEAHGTGGSTLKKRKRKSGGAPVLQPVADGTEAPAGVAASPDNGLVLRRCLTFEATPRGVGGSGRSRGTPLWRDDVATPHPVGLYHPGRASGAFVTPVLSGRVPRRNRSSVEGLPETPFTAPEAGGSMAAPPTRSGGRPRTSNAGDSVQFAGGCHKCRCVKSHCLKLYCECFANGIFCSACSCTSCLNTQGNAALVADTRARIEARNPAAFQPRVIVAAQDGLVTPAHKTGCRCKKSACQKRYCECFEASVLCGPHCKCEGCRNCDPRPGGGGQAGGAVAASLRGPFKLPEQRSRVTPMAAPITPALHMGPDALLSPRLTLSPGLLPLAMPFTMV